MTATAAAHQADGDDDDDEDHNDRDSNRVNGNTRLPTPSPILSPAGSDSDALYDGAGPKHKQRRRSSEATQALSSQALHHLTASPDSLPLRSLDDALPALRGTSEQQQFGMDQEAMPATASPSASSPAPSPRRAPRTTKRNKPSLPQLRTDEPRERRGSSVTHRASSTAGALRSPLPSVLPVPPLSLPTYLHLELTSERPSPLYIHRPAASDHPYETSAVKFERLHNFLMLPLQLERALVFGAIACLDAWLYTFTILPLRFFKALLLLIRGLGRNAAQELLDIVGFTYQGIGRMWRRRRSSPLQHQHQRFQYQSQHTKPENDMRQGSGASRVPSSSPLRQSRQASSAYRHQRTRSKPSALLASHKADLLQGLLIITSCIALMSFDASRMYHSIRGQAAIKLYVIYNVLEVFDRLLSALGQDILECLFSRETLERNADGRSKIIRPFWMFLLALVYVIAHSTALFYQVVALNVAVNSYSNALLTLLMSNQFVEIKGTVFKKFVKENLFQLTCADVVERFQLWLMLLIIALRNIVEVGGLSISLSSAFGDMGTSSEQSGANAATGVPLLSGLVIPKAFTLMPKWTGEVLGPFLIVLGSEALVDWCKHAYISKFNNVKPNIYARFLDVLAKDYYSHAFVDQNLTKRLGLPIIPLSCLFIRAMVQTYHMFLATHMPAPIISSATSISLDSDLSERSSVIMAALHNFDTVLRRALGRSTFGAGNETVYSVAWWSLDDFIALATMVIFFLVAYLILLAFKLMLGMMLLTYARNRFRDMKVREEQSVDTHGRRVGGWGAVEVDEDKMRWIYEDDADGLANLKGKESRGRQNAAADQGPLKLDKVERYSMIGKRIW